MKFDDLKKLIKDALLKVGLSEEDAELLAKVHTESSRDGVYSHGLNRVPKFIELVEDGSIDIHARPTLLKSMAMVEQYDGNFGMGVKNAIFASNRAKEEHNELLEDLVSQLREMPKEEWEGPIDLAKQYFPTFYYSLAMRSMESGLLPILILFDPQAGILESVFDQAMPIRYLSICSRCEWAT